MINEIKIIVQNYLENVKVTKVMVGTIMADSIKITDKLIVPNELVKGNLKEFVNVGDKVRLIRNHGGQEFYIVEIIGKSFITKGSTISLSLDGVTRSYKVEDVIK